MKSAGLTEMVWSPRTQAKKTKGVYSIYLLAIFAILQAIGLANLFSAGSDGPYFSTQLRNLVVSIVAFATVAWLVPVKTVRAYTPILYGAIVISLVVVLALGHTAGGSQRWLDFGGPFRIQPSEIAKIVIALSVARWFDTHSRPQAYRLRDLWPVLSLAGIVFALIFLQPDLGTAGVCLIIAAAQMAFCRLNVRSIGLVVVAALITGFVGWSFLLHPYQKLRILNLLDPSLDPTGSGYNSLQSLIAVGSGSLFGKGYLLGTQTQLQFLPARHTDFVFSVFAEEHGFIGGAMVFALFGALTFVGLEIARHAKDSFHSLLTIGLAALIFFEFAINVSMVLGLFPVVGMPLPFFSYGGSSMLTINIAIGLLIAIDRSNQGLGSPLAGRKAG